MKTHLCLNRYSMLQFILAHSITTVFFTEWKCLVRFLTTRGRRAPMKAHTFLSFLFPTCPFSKTNKWLKRHWSDQMSFFCVCILFSRCCRELNSPQVSIFWKAKFAADVKSWGLLLLQWWESWRWWRRARANPWSNWCMCSRSSPGRWSTSTSLRVSHWGGAQAAALMMNSIATPPLKATSQCRCGKISLNYTSSWCLASCSAFSLSPQVMQVVRMVSAQKVELTFVEHHACECRWITDGYDKHQIPWLFLHNRHLKRVFLSFIGPKGNL